MGVPAFFRWLSRKYPSVIVECVENKTEDGEGRWIPEDATLPNPNGIEFDNLYLDMNGIIHPCTHPEDKPAPKNEDEMMIAIFECIDRLFNIVRPRKVLYMAIDGVAPRAKMNQQRSRRFRASKETVEKQIEIARIREKLITAGCAVPPEKPKGEHFDSNCITPGTPFMERLSSCLHYYIHDRLNNHPAWKGIKVFLSDANAPGEGEHKIMDYIRRQRAQPDHDPNTQHVLCGADADLIMLGLATHEPNFTIIREEFLPNKPRPCEICGVTDHELDKCEGILPEIGKPNVIPIMGSEVKFIFVRLCVLKEYLRKTLAMPNLPFKYDFERAIDDWVFMCFFVGNDFLPHLPSLEIREGAIDRLVELYKKCVYKTGGFLTDSGEVNLKRVQMILTDLGLLEDEIFRQRQKREQMFLARDKANKRMRTQTFPSGSQMKNTAFAPTPLGRGHRPAPIENPKEEFSRLRNIGLESTGNAARHVRSLSDSKAALEAMMTTNKDGNGNKKRKADEMDGEGEEEEDPQAHDEVRLWESGFKDRYYESKFDVGTENLNFRYSVALQYIRGLCWVLKYYYQGCVSWNWYFPYHYAPFASDFVNIEGLSTQFEKGTKPFNPLEQLMGVFPAASSSHVPAPWAKLMSDPDSPIIDFYPEDFKIDLNGKKFAWQGVALLPFVDERRLIKAVQPLYKLLGPGEVKRNQRGDDRLYVGPSNPGYKFIKKLYKKKVDNNLLTPISVEGVQGNVLLAEECIPIGEVLHSPIIGLHDIDENRVLTVRFRDPQYADNYIFLSRRLPNAVDPPTVLAPDNRPTDYRPQTGFTRNIGQASLDTAGHRMVNHHTGNYGGGQKRGGNNYSQSAPPQQYNNERNYNSQNRNQNRGHNNDSYQQNSRYQAGYQQRGGSGNGSHNNYQQNNRSGGYQSNNNNYRGGGDGGGGRGGGGGGGRGGGGGGGRGGGYNGNQGRNQGGGRNNQQGYWK